MSVTLPIPNDLSLELVAFLILSALYISKSPLINSVIVKIATVALFVHVLALSIADAPVEVSPSQEVSPEGSPEGSDELSYPDKDPDQWLGSTDEGRPVQVQPVPPSASHNFWGSIVGASMSPYRAPQPSRSYSSHLQNPNHQYAW
jgi:hypothetical protein